jgi:hypothetical protein
VLRARECWDEREQHGEQDRAEETSISVGHCRCPMLKRRQLIVRHTRRFVLGMVWIVCWGSHNRTDC